MLFHQQLTITNLLIISFAFFSISFAITTAIIIYFFERNSFSKEIEEYDSENNKTDEMNSINEEIISSEVYSQI